MIEDFLKQLGLNTNEIEVYMYLLSHGESIASMLAKRLNIKRSSMYQTLEGLERKYLISRFTKNGVAHFKIEDPERLMELCNTILRQMGHLKERAVIIQKQLEDMHKKGSSPTVEIRGTIQYYEGLSAVTDLIDETIDADETEQLCFGLNAYHTELAGDDWQLYTKKRVAKGMAVKSIQPDTDAAIAYKSRDKKELRETRLVPKDIFPSDCEINIIGDSIAIFSASGPVPAGMKIINRSMAQTLRSLFGLAWERADEYDKEKE